MPSYIFWRPKGGLGNQLFQLNYAEYLRQEKSQKVTICDTLVQRGLHTRLLKWKIHDNITEKVVHCKGTQTEKFSLAPFLAKLPIANDYSYYYGVNSIPQKLTAKHNFGYFQSKEYFNVYLKTKFDHSAQIEQPADVVVHMRLTDNNWLEKSIEYYYKELRKVATKRLLICTDDKIKASKILNRLRISQVDFSNGSALDDFKSLCRADYKILSHSSFSWWAARFSNVDAVVVAPPELINLFGPLTP